MKRFLRLALFIYLALSLSFSLFACGGDFTPSADKGGNNGQEQTTPSGDIIEESTAPGNGENELPLIPFN